MGGNGLCFPPAVTRIGMGFSHQVIAQPHCADAFVVLFYGRTRVAGPGIGINKNGGCRLGTWDASSGNVALCRQRFLSRRMRCHSRSKTLKAIEGEDYCGFALKDMLVVNVVGFRNPRSILITRASGNSSEPSQGSSSITTKMRIRFAKALEVPQSIWDRLVHPLSNFGFGKRSVWEAGVGLFVLSGFVLLFITLAWVKSFQLRTSRKYHATFEFSKAWGITVGTAVRIRGVDVGSVVAVRPSLERLDVQVQIADARVVIPRNALVEVNQSGLVSETLIDITPRFPLPQPTVGPLDPECHAEGLIVCHRDRIKGEQGVSLDELVGICTKLARQIDDQGLQKLFEAAERISLAVEEAKPLLAKAELMAGDVAPLLKEMQEGGFIQGLDRLIRVAAETGEDLRCASYASAYMLNCIS
ncbi:hypothetical protein O6H91_20G018100 [Diphasiastrum complanatum]|uniref:Uncharacterized protein n=1 Tax=Diphasiastrum complanatum TaxID=34168 RepID=A0ACC2AN37_DIPCM|nr:hypothetical protein O6H91_20G018100 [Diphasiastrum complanatum]